MLWWVVDQYQMRHVAAFFKRCGALWQLREIVIAVNVTVDDGEGRIAQQWQRIGNAARSFQNGVFRRVVDVNAVAAAIAQCVFNLHAEVRVIDNNVADTGARQVLDMPHD